MTRFCTFEHPEGRSCGAKPLRSGSLCFWHEPGESDDAREASRIGGLRRKREKALAAAHDVAGLSSYGDVRRLLDITMLDTLGLENSVARNRVLLGVATGATKLIEAEVVASYAGDADDE